MLGIIYPTRDNSNIHYITIYIHIRKRLPQYATTINETYIDVRCTLDAPTIVRYEQLFIHLPFDTSTPVPINRPYITGDSRQF